MLHTYKANQKARNLQPVQKPTNTQQLLSVTLELVKVN
jgi:hypothetical protein